MDEEQKPGFRVTDRRRFTESGERRDAADEAPPAEPAAARPPSESAAPESPAQATEELQPMDEATFSSFVFGLSVEALMMLGEVETPDAPVERNLPAAKHVIDILGILREKTRNNLEQAEEQLLDSILYDLRMRYVKLQRGAR